MDLILDDLKAQISVTSNEILWESWQEKNKKTNPFECVKFLRPAFNLSDVSDRRVQLEEKALILRRLIDQMVLRHTLSLSLSVFLALSLTLMHRCIQQSLCAGLVDVHCRFLARGVSYSRLSVHGGWKLFPANRCHPLASGVLPKG